MERQAAERAELIRRQNAEREPLGMKAYEPKGRTMHDAEEQRRSSREGFRQARDGHTKPPRQRAEVGSPQPTLTPPGTVTRQSQPLPKLAKRQDPAKAPERKRTIAEIRADRANSPTAAMEREIARSKAEQRRRAGAAKPRGRDRGDDFENDR